MIRRRRLKSDGDGTISTFHSLSQDDKEEGYCLDVPRNSAKFLSEPFDDIENPGDDSDTSIITKKRQKFTKRELERIHYRLINERVVNDVTLEFFYKPRTVTVLVIICILLVVPAFSRNDARSGNNVYAGITAAVVLFLVVSGLTFPNGPFIRPHPVFWRIIFGMSVLYILMLQFALFQNFRDIKDVLKWLDPQGLSKEKLDEKAYAVNCSDITLERLWGYMDIFALGHFVGWAMKAVLIRHSIICWYISIAWELTEVFFAHLLPNFQECWWDAIILDILICNGLGIWFGIWLSRFFEMRQFHWESIKDIKTTRGKFKRAVLQFTPESWMKVDWYNNFALRRTLAIYGFVLIWLITELNTFFLKHIFAVDTSHPLVFSRIVLVAFISAPTIRQFYLFATDPRIKRMGMQSWVYVAICTLEAAICIRFGRPQLPRVKLTLIVSWICFMAVGTFVSVWMSVWWVKTFTKTKKVNINGCLRDCYLDSSHENLGALTDEVKARRKRLNIAESDFT
uniref:Phosphatidylserine synthase n=1 Tax=Setaria digitata TaxID=48799 RepID=A0A915PGP1_9BILA